MKAVEANFDGLVGPTHNYGGLSFGNVASFTNQASASDPKKAALQGLVKMKALADMGFVQGVLAPHERPHIPTLKALGFAGTDTQILTTVAKQAPHLLASVSSASCMWTANAATVSPSADSIDGKVHFTPANLANKFHRAIEHPVTRSILQATFANNNYFTHHHALPSVDQFGDEGAANHTRFCDEYSHQGIEFFVYGKEAFNHAGTHPQKYPARQTLEASQAIARRHGVKHAVYAQQNPAAIDAGVFHNDVIAVGNRNVHFYHEEAFLDTHKMQQDLQTAWRDISTQAFYFIEVKSTEVSLSDCIKSYLFNSQLISKTKDEMMLVVPTECQKNIAVWSYLDSLKKADNPINDIQVFDLKQSMSNGGGPACLRLRVVLNEAELAAVNPACLMNGDTFTTLSEWVKRHYRDRLFEQDLADPALLQESRTALDELTQLLKLGSVYDFQKG